MEKEVLFQIVLFFANTVQVITGFAGNLLAMPFSMKLIGMQDAKTVINLFSMFACVIIVLQNQKYIQWRVLINIVVYMIAGMAAGIFLLEFIPESELLFLYSILLICIALKKLFWKKEFSLPHWMMKLVLLMAGMIHGMFLSGGALLVVYALSVLKDKNKFRTTVAFVWIVLDGALAVVYGCQGCYDFITIERIILSIIVLILSIGFGNLLYKKISQKMFLYITYILIFISGISLLI